VRKGAVRSLLRRSISRLGTLYLKKIIFSDNHETFQRRVFLRGGFAFASIGESWVRIVLLLEKKLSTT
jgi:hypothetical protein